VISATVLPSDGRTIGRAVQETQPQLPFEAADLAAHGGLR